MSEKCEVRVILLNRNDGRDSITVYPLQMYVGQSMELIEKALRITHKDELGERNLHFGWVASGAWLDNLNSPVFKAMEKHLLVCVDDAVINGMELEVIYLAASTAIREWKNPDFIRGAPTRNVFIIHGRDDDALSKLAGCVERLGYDPLILKRTPLKGGETVIEALERLLLDALFTVVLFTPDDEGRLAKSSEPLKPRARQNVLVEAGYCLIQRRSSSVIIAIGETEIPSDFLGIRRIEAAKWGFDVEQQLAAAIKGAG